MAQSQYAAREWQSFCDTVTQVRALENVSHTKRPVHDDLELCELSAQRNLHRNWKSALEVTLRCVHSLGADAPHRVKAAITALKLATNIGDLETMDTVYNEMTALWTAPDVRPYDRLLLTMIYHTIRGDGGVSATAARELLLIADRTMPLLHRLPVMLNCATALRRGGAPGESEAVSEETFRTSVALHCFDIAADACDFLIEMHIDAGQTDLASEWERNYLRLRRPKSEFRSHRNLRVALSRLRVAHEEWNAADELLRSRTTAPLWDDAVAMLQSGAIATKLRIEIGRAAQRDVIVPWVAKLASLNDGLRTVGAQDYECYSLYLGYRYIGDAQAAEDLLTNYVGRERRDTRPLAADIAAELARIELSP
jgi:hypothetical protein